MAADKPTKVVIFQPGAPLEMVIEALGNALGVRIEPHTFCPPGRVFVMDYQAWKDGQKPWQW